MRILFLTTTTFGALGGISRYTAHVCKALSEIPGVELDVLSLGDRTQQRDERYLPLDPARLDFVGFNDNRLAFVRAVLTRLFTQTYDVCVIGHAHFLPLILPLRLRHRRPHLVTIAYGIEVWRPLTPWRRAGLFECDQVWAISAHTAERMQATNGVLAKVVVLHNALDPFWAQTAAAYQRQPLPDAVSGVGRSLLTVSRLSRSEHGKGHASVIRALPQVAQVIPNIRYDVVGSGDLIPELLRLAADCGVADRVFFHQNVPDDGLQRFYQACDIFVMPSKKEGFGYVYLEAMFYGKAVVAGCADAGPEVVQHQTTGLIVDPDNIDDVARSLIDLLSDNVRRHLMGEAGRHVLKRLFSFNRFSEEVSLYLAQAGLSI